MKALIDAGKLWLYSGVTNTKASAAATRRENRLHGVGRIDADAGVQIEVGEIDDVEVEAVGVGDHLKEPLGHDAAESALAVAADDHGHAKRI